MKYIFVCYILIPCSLCPVFAARVPSHQTRVPLHQTRQYVYIGGYGGIFGFRVRSDGSLLPLQTRPLAKVFLDQLLVDTRAKNIFSITADNKLYSYAVGPTGRLALKSKIPFDVDFRTAVIDSQTHFLYAADGDHSLLVYDVSNPSRPVRRQNLVTPITIQNVVVDQFDRSLLLCGQYPRATGHGGSLLLRYSLRLHSAPNRVTLTHLQQGINTLTVAGTYLIAGNENTTLTVYSMSGRSVQAVSHQPLLEANAGHLPSNIVYRRTGSFLYISTYYGAGSAQAVQPASAVLVCHLGSGGQLGLQKRTGKPVSNPRLSLDRTEHFLYVVGEEGSVDAYQVLSTGQIAFGSRLQLPMPTGLVFIDAPTD